MNTLAVLLFIQSYASESPDRPLDLCGAVRGTGARRTPLRCDGRSERRPSAGEASGVVERRAAGASGLGPRAGAN